MEATGMEQSQQKRQYREVLLLFLLFPVLVFFRLCHGLSDLALYFLPWM